MQGTSFGKYRLIELLGRGGQGEVWRAHDTVIDRVVAIKILPPEFSRDEVFQQRFRREAHAAARLSSPHVIPIHTHGEIDGRLFVDMRLIEGRDLQSILGRGPMAPERAVYIVDQIAKALHAAHKVGLLHRDVKPSNILLDDDDFAYLIDFGIARAAGELGLTTAGDVIGTFHYMAPERFSAGQLDARPVDARSDIYALTCVLYECLTAAHPFPGDSLEQQLTNHLTAPPPRPSITDPGLPGGFDAVIATGMAKNPDDRYGTAVQLARAAYDAVTTPPAPARARSATPPRGNRQPRPNGRGRPPAPQPQQAPSPATIQHRLPNAVATPRPQPVPAQLPETTPSPSQPWWRRKSVLISTAAVLGVIVVIAGMVVLGGGGSNAGDTQQVALPFTGLREPQGVSVDSGGTVYVADTLHNRVLALAAGSTSPAVLPFDGLNYPTGVTADNSGTVYVTDAGNKRVVVLPAGSTTQTQLPFNDLGNPTGVTVDNSRTVYVTDTAKNRVVALPAGSNRQTELPFTGLNAPTGVVVNSNGTIYVADGGNDQILALAAGSSSQSTLPFRGLNEPGGVTVDNQGAVYVTDSQNNRTLKLPVGSTAQVELPFTGLDFPWGLAVDSNGTVYVAGHSNKVMSLQQK
ncbi:serine/threonine protein kinase [Mycobacterium kyorinense]|uniref:non-specific serine/threonine protein kinase n=1 Tax=Mycobacterium kyorinense TaxID=487514 RepID=A0A1A2YPL8_9MYCO|nr:serine/threonine-protein kinase PknD [Mycobacterium kyorinense]OBI40179.1 serine/threonine protein kinase [Mycobacterium kyorinense]